MLSIILNIKFIILAQTVKWYFVIIIEIEGRDESINCFAVTTGKCIEKITINSYSIFLKTIKK